MLARRLLALLVFELTAYAFVLVAAAGGTLAWPLALAIVAGSHVALRCAAVPLGLLVAMRHERPECRVQLGLSAALAVYARECSALWWHYVLAPFDPWLRPPAATAAAHRADDARRPEVVLVHGILCNRVVWRAFQSGLAARGHAARAVNLSPILGSLDAMAARLVGALQHATGPVVVVAHSMGGLVTRRALQLEPALPVAAVVTIGTPHRGSAQAALVPGAAARAMRRGSRWLADLDRGPPPPSHVRRLAIRSVHDELVTPTDSACWSDARNLVLERVGHVALLGDGRVVDAVAAEIDAVAAEIDAGPVAALGLGLDARARDLAAPTPGSSAPTTALAQDASHTSGALR